ncbi:hypothetical protein EWM64_g5779 [Hericium alpestre]|uniref:Uncharacterized protein n=1 Tax=Hericium alpestre TaxID=135208 RepID=A0A4Y9ZUG2_9AGAM|nr:hypothetical protein EWM64_g5779 [Hericium alpestre]
MSDLYLLLRPVRDILDQWLETHDSVHPFTDHTFDKADYVFSNKENYDFKKVNEMGPVVKFSARVEAVPGLEFHPTKLTIVRRLSNFEAEDNLVFEVKWEGATRVLKVNRQTVDDELDGEDRYLTELNTYNYFLQSGLYTTGVGVVPHPYGYVHIWGRQHAGWARTGIHWPYDSWLKQFTYPAEYLRGILLEHVPDVRLPVKQFTVQNIYDLLDTFTLQALCIEI